MGIVNCRQKVRAYVLRCSWYQQCIELGYRDMRSYRIVRVVKVEAGEPLVRVQMSDSVTMFA